MGSLGKQLWNLASFSHVNFEKVTHAWNSSLLRPASEWVDSTLSPLQCTDRNKPWRESQRLLKSLHNNLGNNISNNTWNQTFKQRKQAWPQLKELNGLGLAWPWFIWESIHSWRIDVVAPSPSAHKIWSKMVDRWWKFLPSNLLMIWNCNSCHPLPLQCHKPLPRKTKVDVSKCHASHAKRQSCVWQSCVRQNCVKNGGMWKMVCDKVVCDKVVCERRCVTKLCVMKLCVCVTSHVWKIVCVWRSCVWKLVCDKVVCVWRSCVKKSVWQSVCVKVFVCKSDCVKVSVCKSVCV